MKKLISLFLIAFIMISTLTTNANAITTYSYDQSFTDKINNIVVLIKFKGELEYLSEKNSIDLENTFNEFTDLDGDGFSDNGSYSLKSYINDLTYGNTTVESSFYPKNKNGTGYISITAPNTRQYYQSFPLGSSEENNFVKWAFEEIKNEIPFSAEELDRDNNGTIDHVTFLVSGVNLTKNMLWPHKTEYYGSSLTVKGKRLSTFNMINVGSNTFNIFNKASLSTAIHEFLHSFGAPDLYNDDSVKKPVGTWDIMSNNSTPGQLPLVYTRNSFLNLGLNVANINKNGTYTLTKSNSKNKNNIMAFTIKSPLSSTEYFMVEYRKQEENYDSSIPGSGLIVYRINESIAPNANKWGAPYNVYIFRPGATDSVSANGDINSAFLSEESGRTSIGNDDLSIGFDDNALYFNDGSNSGIVISNISSSSSDEISFTIKFPNITGDGSITNPFKIFNANDLNRMSSNLDKHFILMNDIDLSNINWSPIGSLNDDYFKGSLNGNGYSIKNLTINNNDSTLNSSLINGLDYGSSVYNLTLENINITTNSEASAITSYNNGTLSNIKITGNITSSSNMGIGGIVGTNGYLAVIDSCISSVNITSTGSGGTFTKPLVGGIAMQNYEGTIKNSFANGKISALDTSYVGGILGRNINATPDTLNNYYDITKTGQYKAVDNSGFLGESDKGFTGIKMPKSLDMKANSTYENIIELIGSNTSSTGTLSTLDNSIATIDDGVITTYNKEGTTTIQYTININNIYMTCETTLIVSGGITSKYDLDGNNIIDMLDLSILSSYYNKTYEIEKYDMNDDKIVDIFDIVQLSSNIY